MPVRHLRAWTGNIAANTHTPFYTCPQGKKAVIKMLYQVAEQSQRMGTTINGTGLIWDQQVEPFASKKWPLSFVMYPGDQLFGQHSAGNAYTAAEVVEVDGPEADMLVRITALNVQNGRQEIAVPAGKKYRCREVIFCNHNSFFNAEVYAAGVAHVARVTCQPNAGVVVKTDWLYPAGGSVGFYTPQPSNQGNLHIWTSGVLEDA